MASQTEYHVVKICRSDGCDTGPGYWPTEAPRPVKKTAKDAPEKATRTRPQMVRLAADDQRFVEWRMKLGILLKQEISPMPNEGLPWYVDFPRGYWLYERSKHLWVSGYPAKAKLFKTPQEFGVHLLWLLSSSEDQRDCCCIHCNVPSASRSPSAPATDSPAMAKPRASEEPRRETPTPYARALSELSASNISPSQLDPQALAHLQNLPGGPLASASPAPTPAVGTSAPRTSSASAQGQRKAPAHQAPPSQFPPASPFQPPVHFPPPMQLQDPNQLHGAGQPQAPVQPQTLGQPQAQAQAPAQAPAQAQNQPVNPQQRVVQVATSLLYRTGELVWYTNGPSWRLGLTVQSANGTHQIMPIGHHRAQQPVVTKTDADLRPFQAFTVPQVTSENIKGRAYDEVPWEELLDALSASHAKKDLGVILLDASKLAALKIDQSHSLFTRLEHKDNMSSYRGVFLGAERIEIGDTLRVVVPTTPLSIAYFGLRMIVAQDQPGGGRALLFRGALYRLREWDEPQTPPGIPDDALPRALREESIWRKSVSPSQPLSWTVLNPDMWLKEADVKGRFYPTHLLGPVLTPGDFADAVARKDRKAVVPALNGRLDSPAGATKNIGGRLNRVVAAGESIPHDTVFSFESYVREDVERADLRAQ